MLFAKGSKSDINVRAAFLHLASDAVVAAGVAATGTLIYFTGILWLYPAASLLVSAIVLFTTWSLLRHAVDLAMHAVPKEIDADAVRERLAGIAGIVPFTTFTSGPSALRNARSAHVVVRAMPSDAVACDMDATLQREFAIHHVTIQIDPEGAACALANDEFI